MTTIAKIEQIIRHRTDLANRVDRAKSCLNHGVNNGTEMLVHPVSASGHNLRIPFEIVRAAIEHQLELLQLELAAIDKQLDAIGALMGVQNG